jgi:hypothetical protein
MLEAHKQSTRVLLLGYNYTRQRNSPSTTSITRVQLHRLHRLYINLAVRRDYSSPATRALHQPRRAPRLLVSGRTRSTSTTSCTASTRHHSPGCSDLPQLHRASGCLGTSRGSSCGLSRRSSWTTSPPPRDRVPQLVTRLVAWLVAPLVVDYSRLVVDYSTARPGASARRAARHAARRAVRR